MKILVTDPLSPEGVKILKEEGFVANIEKKGRAEQKTIKLELKYQKRASAGQKPAPIIFGLKKVSKPGQRIYVRSRNIKPVLDGYGMSIISTSKGLMTGKQARKQRLGGEVICEIW